MRSILVLAHLFAACALAACADSPATVPQATTAPRTATAPQFAAVTQDSVLLPRDELPGLSNFARIDEGLYRGAQPSAAGMEVLQSLGVKTIVNLRAAHSDRDEIAGLGFRYSHISCKAWHPEEEDIVRFLAIARDPENRPVFVHCEHGADRTGMMVAAYRVAVQGWTADAAAEELPRFGFHPIWTGIQERVVAFDAEDLRRKAAAARRETLEIVP